MNVDVFSDGVKIDSVTADESDVEDVTATLNKHYGLQINDGGCLVISEEDFVNDPTTAEVLFEEVSENIFIKTDHALVHITDHDHFPQ